MLRGFQLNPRGHGGAQPPIRVVSHTCSNTEIVCALGAADLLVGVDTDSDHPADVVAALPKLGRDLELDVEAVLRLQPDLVLTSLTVPGHERIVQRLQQHGLQLLVIDPLSLEDVLASILSIGEALHRSAAARALVEAMRLAMPEVPEPARRPNLLVEWWPKPVIAPAAQSWVSDLIWRAGGRNPWAQHQGKSVDVSTPSVQAAAPEAVIMSWCGVRESNYRPAVVRRRPGWEAVPAVQRERIYPVSEAYLGRPGPRLVQGYQALRHIVAEISGR